MKMMTNSYSYSNFPGTIDEACSKMKMETNEHADYLNEVFEFPERRRKPWSRISRLIKKHLARVKWSLKKRGWPVRFSYDDARAARLLEHPGRFWTWDDSVRPSLDEVERRVKEDLIPWMHEAITRSPSPIGIDSQGVMIEIFKNDETIVGQNRMVDKYGWRKEGMEETTTWLIETLGKLSEGKIKVTVWIGSLGRIITWYDLVQQNH